MSVASTVMSKAAVESAVMTERVGAAMAASTVTLEATKAVVVVVVRYT